MLIKLSDDKYILSIDVDEAAALVEDYCRLFTGSTDEYYPMAFEIIKRLNEIYFYQNGCSICSSIEQYENLENSS